MSEPRPQSPYAILGEDGIRALVHRFYDRMSERPDAAGIRAMHAADLEPIREKLAVFLIGWMGGPSRYSERFGRVNVPSAHAPYDIGLAERDAWVACFRDALDGAGLPEELDSKVMTLVSQMAEMSRTLDDEGNLRPQFRELREQSQQTQR